jgi:hypothetical protein
VSKWAGRLWGLFPPADWTKESLSILLTDTLRCAKNEILVDVETQEDIQYFLIHFRSQTLISSMLSGTRATEGSLLVLKEEEVSEQGLQQSIKLRQLKATRVSTVPCQNPFGELCRHLVGFKEFNLRVVTVAPHEDSFVVVVQNKVQGILKFLRISGWKFDLVQQCIKLPAVATARWHKFMTIHKLQ